jgi:hypothetical protein
MDRAGSTPLVATLNRRLELQVLQDGPHRDLLPQQLKVYAGHGTTSSPANREEKPVLEPPGSDALANRSDGLDLSPRSAFVCPGSPAALGISAAALPARQLSPVRSIRHMMVAVRRITATRAIFAPRRRLIR